MKFDIMMVEIPCYLPDVVEERWITTDRTEPDVAALSARTMEESLEEWEARWRRTHRNPRREGGTYVGESKQIRYTIEINTLEELFALVKPGTTVAITDYCHWDDGVRCIEFEHECEDKEQADLDRRCQGQQRMIVHLRERLARCQESRQLLELLLSQERDRANKAERELAKCREAAKYWADQFRLSDLEKVRHSERIRVLEHELAECQAQVAAVP